MMFTGIVEEIGRVGRFRRTAKGFELTVQARTVLGDAKLGDSINVNGTCLTVTQLGGDSFIVGLSPETRSRTNLEGLRVGDHVNLERSLKPASRMGGHFVQGHVDGVGTVTALHREEDALWVTVGAPQELMRYIVPKGFVALDGVSLTVVDVYEESFTVMLVAYTQGHITLAQQQAGYRVNIEVDILGKYVEKQLKARFSKTETRYISLDFLAEHGYQ